MRLAFTLLIISIICFPTHAEIPFEQAAGIYARTLDDKKAFSPIFGMFLVKSPILKRIRFFANYTSTPSAQFPPHPAFIDAEKQKNNCPQDAISALVQYLFPSPDGVNLTHNERNKDPWGIIAREKDFKFINEILKIATDRENYKKKPSAFLGKQSMIQPIFLKLQKLFHDRFQKTFTADKNLELLDDTVSILTNALLQGHHTANSNHRIYPKNFTVHLILAFAWKIADKIQELDVFDCVVKPYTPTKPFDHAQYEGGIGNFLKRFKSGEPPAVAKEESPYNILAHIDYDDELAPYLLGEEFEEYKQCYGRKKEHIYGYSRTYGYDRTYDYNRFYGYNRVDHSTSVTPEEIILFTTGLTTYASAVPELVQYGTTKFGTESYPNCGETSLVNIFYILLGKNGAINLAYVDQLKHKLQKSHTNFDATHNNFLKYFSDYPNISQASTKSAFLSWSNVVSNINQQTNNSGNPVKYRNGTHNLPGSGGIINMLSVIEKLIPDQQLAEKWIDDPEEALKQAVEKLNRFCELFSRDDFELDWNVKGSTSKGKTIKSISKIEITFTVNGMDLFVWEIHDHHFTIRKSADQNDWRAGISVHNTYLTTELLQLGFGVADYPHYVWGNDLGSMRAGIQIIDAILENNLSSLYPLIPNIITKSIPYEIDRQARDELSPILFHYQAVLRAIIPNLDHLLSISEWSNKTSAERLYDACRFRYLAVAKRLIKDNPETVNEIVKIKNDPIDSVDLDDFELDNDLMQGFEQPDDLLNNLAAQPPEADGTTNEVDEDAEQAYDYQEWSALHAAIGCHPIMELLVKNGANINLELSNIQSPLHQACSMGSEEAVVFLVEKGASIDESLSLELDSPESRRIFLFLFQKGAKEISIEGVAAPTGNIVNYVVSDSSIAGKPKVNLLKYLHEKKVSFKEKEFEEENTILHQATLTGDLDALEYIISLNVIDINTTNSSFTGDTNATALDLAVSDKNLPAIKMLIQAGAQVNANSFQQALLQQPFSEEIFEMLADTAKKQGTIDTPNEHGQTVLTLAVSAKNLQAVQILLGAGATATHESTEFLRAYATTLGIKFLTHANLA